MQFFPEFLALLGLMAVTTYWMDAMRSKELAREAGLRACQRAHLQFLDDTVELTKIRLQRDTLGRLVIYRCYRFEFAVDGSNRHSGEMTMLGRRVLRISLGPYGGEWQQ